MNEDSCTSFSNLYSGAVNVLSYFPPLLFARSEWKMTQPLFSTTTLPDFCERVGESTERVDRWSAGGESESIHRAQT